MPIFAAVIRFATVCFLLASAGTLVAQPDNPVRNQFQRQVQASIARRFQLSKTVRRGTNAQQLSYAVSPATVAPAGTAPNDDDGSAGGFADEVAFAVEYLANDPALHDFYTETRTGDTLVARRRPEYDQKSDLRLQKLVRAPNGTIRYLETHIARHTWLYDTVIRIAVTFGPDGTYRRHSLYYVNDILLLPRDVPTTVSGTADYAAPRP